MYHQRTTLNKTTTDNPSTQPRTNTPLTARRFLPSTTRFFSQQRQQFHPHNNHDAVEPYSSDADLLSLQSYHRNSTSRITTDDDDNIPTSSPSTKRKYAAATLEHGKEIENITNCLKTVMKQQEIIVDGLQSLRKNQEKIQKTTNSLLNTHKLNSSLINTPSQLPIYKYKDENLFSSIPSSLSITAILCRIIRKLYSSEEIINGKALDKEDQRFETMKGAMVAAFFEKEPEKFNDFWEHIGIKHAGGQKRAARSRNKKARPDQNQTAQRTGSVMAEVNSELDSQNQFDDDDDDDNNDDY